ncbi:MAG: sulfotransferase [Planctomycetota bacterium]
MQPLFLFSLPRAGSTLLQRILGAHAEIATASEPWLLLPLLYTLKSQGALAEYGHRLAVTAIEDLCGQLPQGKSDYLAEIRELALRLYAKAARRQARYFLDKTPRYHLVASEIIALFPEAKHIFLWRHPLAMVGSYVEFFGRGNWNLYGYRIDLFEGLENLLRAYSQAKGQVHALRYEDLITERQAALKQLFAYLELPADERVAETFSQVKLEGRMGDYAGSKTYSAISSEPLDKWKQTLRNPLRRRWARRYLQWIGNERLNIMGYSLEPLLAELDAVPVSAQHLLSDAVRMSYGALYAGRRRLWG